MHKSFVFNNLAFGQRVALAQVTAASGQRSNMTIGDKDQSMTVDGLIAILQRCKEAGAYYVYTKGDAGVVVSLEEDRYTLGRYKYPAVVIK